MRTVTTNAAGVYSVLEIQPGEYRVKAEAAGFKTTDIGPVVVATSQTATANINLKLGALRTSSLKSRPPWR